MSSSPTGVRDFLPFPLWAANFLSWAAALKVQFGLFIQLFNVPHLIKARGATLKVGGGGGLTSDSKWGGG